MSNFEEERMDNWRQFQGTELGSLLSSLYGGNKPVIKYPKVRTRPSTESKALPAFRPVCNRPDAEDPSKSTRRAVNIHVPKVYDRRAASGELDDEHVLPVQYIARRRSEGTIRKEIDEIRERQTHYRPAYVKPISEDGEKDRLNQIFTYKGGKALPNELIAPASEAPFERAQKEKERARMDEWRRRRGLAVVSDSSNIKPKAVLSPHEMLMEQISSEISERQKYLESGVTVSRTEENRLKSEIAQRVNELRNLEMKL